MFDGVSYNGDISTRPTCDQYHSVHVSAQFLQTPDGRTLFGVGPNDNFVRSTNETDIDYNIGCVGQMWYELSYGNLQTYRPQPGEPDIAYLNCTLNAFNEGYTYSSIAGKAVFSDDLGTLTIDTQSACFNPIVLQREARPGAIRTSQFDITWPRRFIGDGQ